MPEQPGDDLPLTTYGSWATRAWRSGATVVRQAGPWTPAVLALLKHFEQVGFAGAPKVVSTGLDADGREVVTYLPGSSPHPRAWTDDAVHELGRVLRAAHDAARSFQPPASARWRAWFGRDLPGDDPVIGHCDPGPWNWVAVDDTRPYALIDWEFAGPVDALREVAHAAWLNAQLHDDDIAKQHVLPEAGARARQARLLLDGYRLSAAQRVGMLDRMIELAIHSARAEAVQHTVSAASPDGHDNDNYPVLWAVTWRTRSASWMLRNRTLLTRAIEQR